MQHARLGWRTLIDFEAWETIAVVTLPEHLPNMIQTVSMSMLHMDRIEHLGQSRQIESSQVKSGQFKSNQVKSSQVKTLVKQSSGQVKSSQGQAKQGQVKQSLASSTINGALSSRCGRAASSTDGCVQ